MNNLGKMYQVKQYYWMLFPNKETALVARSVVSEDTKFASRTIVSSTPSAWLHAAYLRKRLDCNVTYISPNDPVVLLEVDGECKKLLSSNGVIGWTWFSEPFNDCFEEVNQ